MKRLLALMAVLAMATFAYGQVWWDEHADGGGDAGDLPGTAQVPGPAGEPLVTITGMLEFGGNDADMYYIHIDDPATFRAQTWPNSALGDSQLWLFDETGVGITFNDDDPGGTGGLLSTITGTYVPGPGNYYLAVSCYDFDAGNAAGLEIWQDSPYDVERTPDGPGAPGPVAMWVGSGYYEDPYQIDLTGASCVPEPTSLALLALGGLALLRRR